MSSTHEYPPLVTDRSPSMARAQEEEEHHSSSATGVADAVALLALLSEAEANARKAQLKVADMVTFEEPAKQTRAAAAKHEAHRVVLAEAIEALGGSAPRPDECRDLLSRGIEAVAHARSETEALDALTVIDDELSTMYSQALESPALTEQQRALLAGLAAPIPHG